MDLQNLIWRRAAGAVKLFSFPRPTFFRKRPSPSARSGRFGKFARNERGASLVEFAICCPILFAFVFGLMEVCLAFYTHEYISELAREGTRWAMVRGAGCSGCTASEASIEAYVNSIPLPNLAGGKMTPVATYPDGAEKTPDRVQIVITYVFPYNIPFVTKKNLTMTTSSEMPIIQ